MEVVESAPSLLTLEGPEHGEVEYDGEEEDYWSSESEVGDALDWLDSKEGADGDGVTGSSFSVSAARRPNAHGGILSRPFQPLTNRSQKFASHIRANPLEEWEGRMDIGMSNSVTTAIRETVRDAAIGRIKNTEKADRATVEQKHVQGLELSLHGIRGIRSGLFFSNRLLRLLTRRLVLLPSRSVLRPAPFLTASWWLEFLLTAASRAVTIVLTVSSALSLVVSTPSSPSPPFYNLSNKWGLPSLVSSSRAVSSRLTASLYSARSPCLPAEIFPSRCSPPFLPRLLLVATRCGLLVYPPSSGLLAILLPARRDLSLVSATCL
ncbi:hypothetical protein KSP39_PZI012449 [Platanthera zijinensis]|uniref:Uncharacterized protein n=1 Tax=Platanthera zijinensis TaxID=2320716 RepID=A0AAP0BEU5_9ASPA